MRVNKLLILFLFLTTGLFAQRPQGGMPGGNPAIRGVVMDENKEPIPYATVKVLKMDSSFVDGISAKEDGRFMIPFTQTGEFIVSVEFIGYKKFYQNIKIETVGQIRPIPVTLEEDNENLEEVVVESEANLIETKIDKKVFNADQQITAAGGTGLDLIKNVPGIDVDGDDNISLRGNANVQILIDGRPSILDASTLLQQIPAENIEKIEIITNPSARFNPEGTSGILNIILKKKKESGFNGSVNVKAGYGRYPKGGTNVGLNYRNKKINISSNIGYDYRQSFRGKISNRENFLQSPTDPLKSNFLLTDEYGKRTRQNINGKLGLDYFINDKNTFYINGGISGRRGDNEGENEYQITDFDERVYQEWNRFTQNRGDNLNFDINTGWQAKFKKPEHTLDLDVTYSNGKRVDDGTFYNAWMAFDSIYDRQTTYEANQNHQLLQRLDYKYPFNDSMSLSAGVHTTFRQISQDFDNQYQDLPSSNQLYTFEFNDQVYAGYFEFRHQVNKFGYQLGLRAEQTMTNSALSDSAEKFVNNYFALFPTIHLSYKLNKTNEIQLSGSRRINRPSLRMLNPFPDQSDPFASRVGNPYLKPEFIYVGEFNYVRYAKTLTLSSSLYYKYKTDLFQRSIELNGQRNLVYYRNLSSGHDIGVEGMINWRPKPWVSAMLSYNYWFNFINEKIEANNNDRNSGWMLFSNINFKMPKDYSIQVVAHYRHSMKTLQGEIVPMFFTNLAFSKKILKKKGTITLNVNDIFNTQRFAFKSLDLPQYQYDVNIFWESTRVMLNFSYNFGKQQKGGPRRRSNRSNSDGGGEDMGF